MDRRYPVVVTLNGQQRTYSPAFQTSPEFSAGWQSVLRMAYGRAELQCGCSTGEGRRLAVKFYAASDSYDLARFSLSGQEHDTECQYYATGSSAGGLSAYARGVIDPQADGSVKIRLAIALAARSRVKIDGAPPVDRVGARPGTRQSAMTLLGLLHYLWSEAQLNAWHPAWAGKRSDASIPGRLMRVAESIQVGKATLAGVLLVPARKAHWDEAKDNARRVEHALTNRMRMIAVAPLASYSAERETIMSERLVLSSFFGMPMIFLEEKLWDAVKRTYPLAVRAWCNGQRVIALAQVELRAGKKGVVAQAIDVALMIVTADWIPVESGYELLVAEQLVEQGRSFYKPLRFDAGGDVVHPDFMLMDQKRPMPMEVFGRSDPEYVERMAKKIAHFNGAYGHDGWWRWRVEGRGAVESMPPFPDLQT
jgi:hypothetical protein